MGWFEDLLNGTSSPIGSASDVQMVNSQDFGNYMNFIKKMLGGYGANGQFQGGDFYNQFLSQQPALAQAANTNVNQALSDVYSTGRAQAQAAADQARKSAASDLAAAGLLNTGAAVNSLTEATANPIMQMETNLAQLRSQAYQNQLAQLQGLGAQGYDQLLGQYGQASEPYYWQPQYQQNPGLLDWITGLGGVAVKALPYIK